MFFRRKRIERALKKHSKDGFCFYSLWLGAMGNHKDDTYTGGKTRLLTDFFLEREKDRAFEEKPKRKTPLELTEEYIEKYKDTELRNCPFCYGSASLSIYLHNYDFHSGFPGGYDIYARIHCKNCSCGLDEIKLETNIHPVERDIDELIKDYAQKWNTRHDDKACRHNSSAPGKLFYNGLMKDIQFKEDKPNE